jgi:glycosyltransferase involved in cell wall biosynthesis
VKSIGYDFSVMVISYNHEKFIGQTLSSILSQTFNGSLQVVIGVDKSTDGTLAICEKFREDFPDKIDLIGYDVNIGMFNNFVETLKRCEGKYISILEGDDYWTYPNKLQDQFDFFERHPNCILSAGLVDVVDEHSKLIEPGRSGRKGEGEILLREDIIIINQLQTLTTAFRKDAVNLVELEKLKGSPHLDWSFYISLNYPENGFIYRFNKVFGAYRKHSGGVYSLIDDDKRNENILKTMYSIYNLDLDPVSKEYLKALFANYSLRLKSGKLLLEEPYRSFFDDQLIIYTKTGRIKSGFLKDILLKAFSYLRSGANKELLKLRWELIRQTRLSKKTYINIFLLCIFPIILLMRKRDSLRKIKLTTNK